MRGADQQQVAMFSSVSPEARIPAHHALRAIRGMLDTVLRDIGFAGHVLRDNRHGLAGAAGVPGAPGTAERANAVDRLQATRGERRRTLRADKGYDGHVVVEQPQGPRRHAPGRPERHAPGQRDPQAGRLASPVCPRPAEAEVRRGDLRPAGEPGGGARLRGGWGPGEAAEPVNGGPLVKIPKRSLDVPCLAAKAIAP